MIIGRFQDGLPRVSLELPTQTGERAISFIVDTGFDGDLSLPESIASELPNAVRGSRNISLAGGFGRRCDCYEISWEDDEGGEERTLEILVLEGNPLLGNGFLAEHLLTIEVTENGEVLAESL